MTVTSAFEIIRSGEWACVAKRVGCYYIMASAMGSSRYDLGSASVSSKSMRELLELANHYTIHGESAQNWWNEYGVENKPRTLFKGPATDTNITELEERLGLTLPEDYKEFLRVSNGFGSDGDDFLKDDGMYNGLYPEPALWSTRDVAWHDEEAFTELPVRLLELPYAIEELAFDSPKRTPEGRWIGDFEHALPLFGPVLAIGNRDIENLWLVRPELVKSVRDTYYGIHQKANEEQKKVIDSQIESFAGSREEFDKLEWCCVRWASGGAAQLTAWKHFGQYVEDTAQEAKESRYGLEE